MVRVIKIRNKNFKHLNLLFCPKDNLVNGDLQKQCLYAFSMPGYEGQNFYNYTSSTYNYVDQNFDIVLIGGRARNTCLTHANSKVKINGYLILDNGDRERYSPNEILPKDKFTTIYNLWSPCITSVEWIKTLIFQRNA